MDNPYIKENAEGVISFNLLKVEHGIKKICQCENPHYEIDLTNRLVVCTDCGAIIEPFEALLSCAKHMEKYSEYQKKAIEATKTFRELAEHEKHRRFKNAAFKEMDEHYKIGLHPRCPKCGEYFDPVKIVSWSRK